MLAKQAAVVSPTCPVPTTEIFIGGAYLTLGLVERRLGSLGPSRRRAIHRTGRIWTGRGRPDLGPWTGLAGDFGTPRRLQAPERLLGRRDDLLHGIPEEDLLHGLEGAVVH